MPEGPLGFPRFSTLGPLTRETEADLRKQWDSCDKNARDEIDIEICRTLKETAIKLISDQDISPVVQDLKDINSGFCLHASESVLENIVSNEDVRILQDSTMGFNHCWIEYNGKHFDTEVPSGVNDPGDLPAWKREGIQPTEERYRDITEGF